MTTTTVPATQTYHRYIRATPQQIWDALTQPEHGARYLFGALVEPTAEAGTPFRYLSPDRTTLWGDDTVLDAAQRLTDRTPTAARPPLLNREGAS